MCDVAPRNIRAGRVVVQIRDSLQNHMIVGLERNLIDDARFPRLTALAAASILLSALAPRVHAASQYVQHNLVSDVPGTADQTDPNLVNPLGDKHELDESVLDLEQSRRNCRCLQRPGPARPSGQSPPRRDSSSFRGYRSRGAHGTSLPLSNRDLVCSSFFVSGLCWRFPQITLWRSSK